MSPRASAPNMASVIACVSASASECPSAPRSDSISTPPRIRGLPATSRWMSFPKPMRYISIRSTCHDAPLPFDQDLGKYQIFRVRDLNVRRASLDYRYRVAQLFDEIT